MSSQETDRGADAGRQAPPARHVPKWLAVLAVVVLVAGLSTLGLFGVRYVQARSAQDVATQRDEVADVAAQVIINAFSFDYRDVDSSLDQLASASTGDFLTEQEQWGEDVRNRVVEQKAVTTATVGHTAVKELDLESGRAEVLVVFTAHSEREGQEDITGRQAMRVDLTRVDGHWKADAVNQVGVTVPVGRSSQSVQELELSGAGDSAGPDDADDGSAGDEPSESAGDGQNGEPGEGSPTAPTSAPGAGG